jgi:hypothetical protein
MAEEKKQKSMIERSKDPGFFENLSNQIKLVIRLLGDSRVSPFLKLLPVGSVIYLLVPDLVLGPVDDAVAIGLGVYMFVELCPPDVVEEHKAALRGEVLENKGESGKIVDGEFSKKD